MPAADPRSLDCGLRVGTSSWTAKGWESSFYPERLQPRDYITHYATRFNTVETDMTFYRIPAPSMVRRWREATPEGFQFAAKVPQVITHEKRLEGCRTEVTKFLKAMDELGDRLGPLLLQFPYLNKQAFASLDDFLARLGPFLKSLPKRRWAVEVRNRNYLKPALIDLLRERGVAFTFVDYEWMPKAGFYDKPAEWLTSDFAYVRWIGNRKEIEKKTRTWDKVIVDRREDLAAWIPVVKEMLAKKAQVYAFFNNHYGGHAPGSIALFAELWHEAAG